jgi:NAD-dependent deacetylase
VQQVRNWISEAGSIAVLTGAGISAESGIPTFRSGNGLWKNYRAEDLATPEAFERDPRLVWEWYDWRRSIIAKAEPNPGHHALAKLEQKLRRFTLITQNVDGLHDRAGSRGIVKLHGDIWTVRCTGCASEWTDGRPSIPEIPPRCGCGALLRPGVVWFGEPLPPEAWQQAEHAAASASLFLVVGTSSVVYPAAGLAGIARAGGARIVEINPEETPQSGSFDYCLRGRSGELLPQLIA